MADSDNESLDRLLELRWRRLASRAGPALPLFDVAIDRYEHPQTQVALDRLALRSVDWVNLVAMDRSDRCIMVRQFRFGAGYVTLETPGGMVDAGENSEAAARRELLEETGYGDGEFRYLGAVEPNPAIHDHLCHHWLATDLRPVAPMALGTGESIELALLSPDAVRNAARDGTIRHALALSALARVFPLWQPVAADVVERPASWDSAEWLRHPDHAR